MNMRLRALQAWLVVAFVLGQSAGAATRLELDTVLNGAPPGSSPPWLTATFNSLFPGTVELTLEARLDVPSEFISEIALNLNPDYNPSTLQFAAAEGPLFQRVNTSNGGNTLSLTGAGAGGGGCDVLIQWPSGGGSQSRFDGTDRVVLWISGPEDLEAEDFLFFNSVSGADGRLIVGAHVQGIPAGPGLTTSGAIIQPIPEPRVLALLVLGWLVFLLQGSRRSKADRRPH